MSNGQPPAGQEDPNLELVRRGFAAYATGDRARLIATLHPEVELAPLAPDLSGTDGPYYGHAGAEQWLDDLGIAAREFSGAADEIRHAGDTVVVLGRVNARSPSSGFAYTQKVGWVLTIEHDLVKSFRGYTDPAAALQAAGLEP